MHDGQALSEAASEWIDAERVEIAQPDPDVRVHELIERHAMATPGMLALELDGTSVDGRQRYTYAELDATANRVARYLRERGVRGGALVGIYLDACPELVISILAVLKLGAAYVPLEPTYPRARLAAMLEDAGLTTVLSCRRLEPGLAPLFAHPLYLDEARPDWVDEAEHALEERVPATSLAYAIYTSGSTGRPKGVMIEHAGLSNNIQGGISALRAGPGTRMLQYASIGFDLSVWEIFVCLCAGGTLCLPGQRGPALTAELGSVLRRLNINTVTLPPAVLWLLNPDELPGVRQVASGGEALPAELVARWKGRRFLNLYGPTEVSVICMAALCRGDGGKPGIGFPFPNQELYVVDPVTLTCVPDGEEGELCVAGVGVARGYLRREALTAERFLIEPWSGRGARMYRTGDHVRRLRDGSLEFFGRQDDQVKLNGQRIELGEIESVLREHPSVGDAAVMVWRKSGVQRLVAFVVARGSVASSELASHLAERLPRVMIPEAVHIVTALPLNAHGKLDRAALTQALGRDAPTVRRDAPAVPAFRTEHEARIAALWAQVIGDGGSDQTEAAFARGLDSLLAIRLAEEMCRSLGLELPLHEFLLRPSFEGACACARPLVDEGLPQPSAPLADEGDAEFPLTPLQRAYALGQVPGTPLGHVPTLACIEYERARIDAVRLEAAAQHLVERHDTLRVVRAGYETQRLLDEVPRLLVPEHDLRGLDLAEQGRRLEALRREMAATRWDAQRLPRFALDVIQLDASSRMSFRFDFSLLDYWSAQRLVDELMHLYERPLVPLPPLRSSFQQFARMRAAKQVGARHVAAQRYWSERARTLPGGPALPEAPPTPGGCAAPPLEFVRHQSELGAELWAGLRAAGAAHGLTPAALLMAAFAEVLSHWTDSDTFCINVPLFDHERMHFGAGEALGDFSTIELLEVTDPYGGCFVERAQRLQSQLWRDFEHRHFDGVDVLREVNRVQLRPLGATMPIVFTSLLQPAGVAGISAAVGRQVWGHSSTPQVALDCHVREAEGVLHFNWDAVDDLFPTGLIAAMFRAFERLLQHLGTCPGSWHSSHLDLASACLAAGHVRVEEAVPRRAERESLHVGLLRWSEREPKRLAVASSQGTWSYADLTRQARRVASELVARGAQPGAITAVCLRRGCDQLAAACGVLLAGGVYLPLAPALPRERLRLLLREAGARHVVGEADAAAILLPEDAIEWVDVQRCGDAPASSLEPQRLDDDLAYVIYTSGSTGVPSGVMMSHGAASNTIVDINRRFGVGPDDRVLAISEPSFDLSIWDLFGLLHAGGAIVVPDAARARDPEYWIELMREHRVSVWNSVPTLLEMLVSYAEGMGVALPSSLRLFLVSGDWIATDLPQRVAALLPGSRFISLGGATEAAIWSIFHEVMPGDEALPSIPYGSALENQRVTVLGRSLAPAPVDVPGELFIGGAGLALGYLGEPEKTAQRFITHPATGERLYRTGDYGRLTRAGYIEFLGRRDQQVKIRGHRIELGEIEAALRQTALVAAAAVVATGGRGGTRRLVAFVVPAAESPAPNELASAVRGALARTLPDYMVPHEIRSLEAMPLTATGKVDRKRLTHWAGELVPARPSLDPADGARQVLIGNVWKQVLRISSVGAHDNFFELGGDSLLAIQAVTRIHRLGLRVSVDMLYRNPTLAGLASAGAEEAGPKLGALAPEGELPVVPGQAWFFEQGLLEPHLWHEGHVLQVRGRLDVARLRRVLRSIVAHHHALRSRFVKNAVWTQRIERDEAIDLVDVVPVSELAPGASPGVTERVAGDLQRRLSLEHGPLLRAAVIVGQERDEVVLVGHHLVLDGFSWRIVLEDIQTLYLQEGATLQETDSFRAWAHALRDRAAQLGAEELEHWSRVSRPPFSLLPLDAPGAPSAQSVCSVYASVSPDMTSLLHTLAPRASLQEVLLASWAIIARDLGGEPHVVVDLLSHGRAERAMQRSVGRTVGRFSAVYPVRVELPADGSWEGALLATRQALAAAPDAGFNFGVLQYMSPSDEVQSHLQGLPRAQVCFNYAGQFDASLLEDSPFSSLREVPRSGTSPMAGERRYLLEINCGILDGQLGFEWRFSANVLDPETVHGWASRVVEQLEHFFRRLASAAAEPQAEVA